MSMIPEVEIFIDRVSQGREEIKNRWKKRIDQMNNYEFGDFSRKIIESFKDGRKIDSDREK